MAGDAGVAVEDRTEPARDVFGLLEVVLAVQEQVQLFDREAGQRIAELGEHGRDVGTVITDVVRLVGADRGSFAGMTGEAGRIARNGLFGRGEHRQQGDDAWIHVVFIGVLRSPLRCRTDN